MPRLVRTHTGGDVSRNLLLKMKPQLVIKPVSRAIPQEQHLDAHRKPW
jgi:hypothetical protein